MRQSRYHGGPWDWVLCGYRERHSSRASPAGFPEFWLCSHCKHHRLSAAPGSRRVPNLRGHCDNDFSPRWAPLDFNGVNKLTPPRNRDSQFRHFGESAHLPKVRPPSRAPAAWDLWGHCANDAAISFRPSASGYFSFVLLWVPTRGTHKSTNYTSDS